MSPLVAVLIRMWSDELDLVDTTLKPLIIICETQLQINIFYITEAKMRKIKYRPKLEAGLFNH